VRLNRLVGFRAFSARAAAELNVRADGTVRREGRLVVLVGDVGAVEPPAPRLRAGWPPALLTPQPHDSESTTSGSAARPTFGRSRFRRRLFLPAIERANGRLVNLGIEPIGKVSPHGLRRTFAALRCVAGDDPAYIAEQIGHEDAAFTLRVYTHAVKRRQRFAGDRARPVRSGA
jgi:hypothetical protein